MKVLKWIAGIVVLLIVIFILIGVFVPSFTYVSQINVNAPAEHAWAVFTDDSRMSEWMEGFKSMENISGNEFEVGSKWKLVIEQGGEEMEMVETVTGFKENELFAFRLENDVMFVDVDITFDEQDGKTEIKAANLVEGRNILWKSLFAMMKSTMASSSQGMYDNLAKMIETTPVNTDSTMVN